MCVLGVKPQFSSPALRTFSTPLLTCPKKFDTGNLTSLVTHKLEVIYFGQSAEINLIGGLWSIVNCLYHQCYSSSAQLYLFGPFWCLFTVFWKGLLEGFLFYFILFYLFMSCLGKWQELGRYVWCYLASSVAGQTNILLFHLKEIWPLHHYSMHCINSIDMYNRCMTDLHNVSRRLIL